MAKKIQIDNLIVKEIQELEEKVKEFQTYLRINTIISTVIEHSDSSNTDYIRLTEEQQEKLHKEILVQIKMQDAVFNWLPLLKKLRESTAEKEMNETRGDIPINGMFKNKRFS